MSTPIALAVGSLIGGGMSLFGSKKSDDMPSAPPAPPPMPELPKAPTEEQASYNKSKARDKERKRNLARAGRSSTILTGALGDTTEAKTSKKTLLGS